MICGDCWWLGVSRRVSACERVAVRAGVRACERVCVCVCVCVCPCYGSSISPALGSLCDVSLLPV